jgi:hypothetical protein
MFILFINRQLRSKLTITIRCKLLNTIDIFEKRGNNQILVLYVISH